MLNIQKHIIVLTTIFLWSCVSVFAGEVRITHFLKDSYASGERTVKSSGENAAMFVNAEFAGGMTNTAKFSLYVSPYLVANQGGRYTKHIYIGSQRIVSKLGDLKSYGADPRRIEYAGSESDGPKVDYKTKYALQQQVIKDNFAHFDVPYNGADNNDYVDGKGFAERDGSLKSAMLKAAMAKAGNKSAGLKDNFQQGDSYEQHQYFYHPDHLGSSSFITNTEGEVVQHIEYVPYGEVFIEERNNVWNTPYLFNAKEFDEETGLYYYGARYYDSRLAMWYGVDALAEEYPNMSPYNYCMGNPVKFVDVDGNIPIETIWDIGNVIYDFGAAITNHIIGDHDAAKANWTDFGLDVAAVLIPYVPAGASKFVKAGEAGVKALDKTIDAEKAIDKGTDVGKVIDKAEDAGKTEKTYQTYTKTNPETGEVYSGRTSGKGKPDDNVAKRDRNHHMNKKGFGPAVRDKSSSNKDAIRGREQQLIDMNGGAKSQGGTSGNAINGISPNNPNAGKYRNACENEFGK